MSIPLVAKSKDELEGQKLSSENSNIENPVLSLAKPSIIYITLLFILISIWENLTQYLYVHNDFFAGLMWDLFEPEGAGLSNYIYFEAFISSALGIGLLLIFEHSIRAKIYFAKWCAIFVSFFVLQLVVRYIFFDFIEVAVKGKLVWVLNVFIGDLNFIVLDLAHLTFAVLACFLSVFILKLSRSEPDAEK